MSEPEDPIHQGFLSDLHEGRVLGEERVAQLLRDEGLDARTTEYEDAKTRTEANATRRFVKQEDVVIDPGHIVLEVKAIRHSWTGPHDYPFNTTICMATAVWDRKQTKPFAHVTISQFNQAIIVVYGETWQTWTRRLITGRSGFPREYYMAAREYYHAFPHLVARLRKLTNVRYVPPSREQLEAEAKGRRRLLYVRERALMQNAREGYIRPGFTKPQPYTPPPEYAALEREFAEYVPDEEWQSSPWRMR